MEWTVQDGRLFSGADDNLDRGVTRTVTVPASGDATLSADLEWGTELGWDFGFVQVFDPAEGDWVSLSDNEGNTTSEHDPGAVLNVVAELPGFTGPSGAADESSGVTHETFDLSLWAGQTIDIALPLRRDRDGNFVGSLRGNDIRKAIGDKSRVVSAIVTADDPEETAPSYPRYKLTVNGGTQPG